MTRDGVARRLRVGFFLPSLCVVGFVFVATPFVYEVRAAAPDNVVDAAPAPADLVSGRKLFERVWLPSADAKKDDDGLGPFFNERSCVACHSQGGIGGGGPNEKNVELLTVVVPEGWRWTKSELQSVLELNMHHVGPGNPQLLELERRATLVHQGLRNGSMVLHSFSNDSHYAANRERLLGLVPTPERLRVHPADGSLPPLRRAVGTEPVKTIQHETIALQLSSRNSTAMFGAGLIDQIPEQTLREIAAEQAAPGSKVSGRYVGKFGWRGQLPRLDSFVFGACDIELGLVVEEPPANVATNANAPAAKPAKPAKPAAAAPTKKPQTFDIGVKDTDDLVAFVASLPTPQRRLPADEAELAAVARGEKQFVAVGCADCHRPSIGSVEGLYSDLLVHDMGQFLADPSQPANLTDPKPMRFEQVNLPPTRTLIQYYGKSRVVNGVDPRKGEPQRIASIGEEFGERLQEWKTPPLWGVADSAPYLHDGRAATLDEAITWHGGEAKDSVGAYRLLAEGDRGDLLKFLGTLKAPPGLTPTTP